MTGLSRLAVGFVRRILAARQRLLDRWQTMVLTETVGECGRGVRAYYPCRITGPASAKIGSNVHVNRGAYIRAEGGLTIGDNVHIGRNLVLYTINHNYEGQALPYDGTVIAKPVTIGRNVWIGINVTIVPGVVIGDGAIVAAGTVVSSDVPERAIVGSQPQRIIGYRNRDRYDDLERNRRFGGVGGAVYSPEDE